MSELRRPWWARGESLDTLEDFPALTRASFVTVTPNDLDFPFLTSVPTLDNRALGDCVGAASERSIMS